jgi:hypothetical protein
MKNWKILWKPGGISQEMSLITGRVKCLAGILIFLLQIRNFMPKLFILLPFLSNNGLIKFFFFGNYFYGLCVIALSIEACLQQKFPLNSIWYFLAVFCVTVVFYTKAYITDKSGYSSDERNHWYILHKNTVRWSQVILTVIIAIFLIFFLVNYWEEVKNISILQLFLFLIFPLVAGLYYGINPEYNLRKIGWLKPFIIGFAWAGMVNFYPVLFYSLQNKTEYHFTVIGNLLFLKNFMFISVLCIMFDIKDYAADAEQRLNTFIVKAGLRKTIFLIIIPLSLVGLGTFVIYGITKHFHPLKITLNVIPFALLVIAAYSLQNRKPLMYYLILIDGLMLVKAVCGSLGMILF